MNEKENIMGLDMYVRTTSEVVNKDVDFITEDFSEFWYWHKNPDVHGWFNRLYIKKGGQEEFNCTPVKITKQDLLDLQADLENNSLETTTGFFFGQTDEYKLNDAKEFVKSALLEIDGVTTMFYTSWW